ncbi:alpha/beta fold hydrolase [Mycolicibacterium phlei]
MSRGLNGRQTTRGFAPELPESRPVAVRSRDGIRLHAEVFGPEDGYPIVLVHGITCAIRVWANQIADLAQHYRVIAYDHRGHGRSAVPARRRSYSLDHLAADLDSVLDATLASGERAVIAGHSMGGIAISSWAERHPERVSERADGVALINTTSGDLLHNVQWLRVPPPLAGFRVRTAGTVLRNFGSVPLVPGIHRPNKRFVSMLAVGRDAEPAVTDLVYELFTQTAAVGRGGWARALVEGIGARQFIGLDNLVVPTLVIGSQKDRLLPLTSARRIANEVPNLAQFVELPGGHCSILEHPDEVNRHLRMLVESVSAEQRRISS